MREKLLYNETIGKTTIEFYSEPGDHYLIVVSFGSNYSSQVYNDKEFAESRLKLIIDKVKNESEMAEICEILSQRK